MDMNLPGGPTVAEVMAVSLFKLGIRQGETAADIGCGTGTVTKEIAKTAGLVYAVDAREEACKITEETRKNCGAENIEIFHGEALDFLASPHKRIDCAFLGGSRDIEKVLEMLVSQGARSIVVNAVLIETAVSAINKMKELGIFREAVHLQVSRSYELTGRTMFKPNNPIYIIHGERKC